MIRQRNDKRISYQVRVNASWPVVSREHEGTEGHWGRWPGYVDAAKVTFSFRKSVFRDVRTDYNLDLRFLAEKANFNDNGGFVVGIQEVSAFRGIQEVSARRVRKKLVNNNLYLFA